MGSFKPERGSEFPSGLKEVRIVAPISIEANRVDHDHTALLGAVWSVSIQFVEEAFKTFP